MSVYLNHDTLLNFKLGKTTSLGLSPEDEAVVGPYRREGGKIGFVGDGESDCKWQYIITNIPQIAPARTCNSCFDSGWEAFTFMDETGNLLVVESQNKCQVCIAACQPEIRALLPPLYEWVDYTKLEPFPKIDVPIGLQQRLIDQIKGGELDGHSIHYCGPSRAGKSVLVSALRRMVHRYISDGFFDQWPHWRLPIYRVNADIWIDDFELWKFHGFTSQAPRPPRPEVNPSSVGRLMLPKGCVADHGLPECPKGFPPVLILEEIDKFSATDFKCRILEGLLNAVFEAGGMIVSASNTKKAELRERLPDWLYRRLVESSVDHTIRLCDLHDAVAEKKRALTSYRPSLTK